MGKLFRGIFTLGVIGFVIYNNIPRYHEFDRGQYSIGPGEYNYYQIDSEGPSPVKIEFEETSGANGFDVFLMTEAEFEKLQEWMQSDEVEQPDIDYISSWVDVKRIDQDSIVLPKGTFYAVVDNTLLGSANEDGKNIVVDFIISEEY